MEGIGIMFFIIILILFILIMRAVGAWMLRIDEVIKNQKIMIQELKKFNKDEVKYLDEL
jgi:Na+-transporting methylmalonyl-CoA/oxaloacetate decarboxylase gamma subunit